MKKWEYCQVIRPLTVDGKLVAPMEVIFFAPSKADEQHQAFDDLGVTLAQLGADGWEMVSHTQTFTLVKGSLLPIAEEYHFKRQMQAA